MIASCHTTPKKGEIWRNAVPYTMDVKVDSVVDNQLVMYSYDVPDTVLLDSAAERGWPLENILGAKIHERGVCQMDSFIVRGFKVGEVGPVKL